MGQCFCEKCKRTMSDKEFSGRIFFYPESNISPCELISYLQPKLRLHDKETNCPKKAMVEAGVQELPGSYCWTWLHFTSSG